MGIIKLYYTDRIFVDSLQKVVKQEQAMLELNEEQMKAKLLFLPTISLVDKRTAERLAQNICKFGFVVENGSKVGVGYSLEIK